MQKRHIWGFWVSDVKNSTHPKAVAAAWYRKARAACYDVAALLRGCNVKSIEGRECGILTGGECIRISRRCLCAAGPRRRRCLRFPVYPVAVGAILITNNKGKSGNLHRKQTSAGNSNGEQRISTPSLHCDSAHTACICHQEGKSLVRLKVARGIVWGAYANIDVAEAVAHGGDPMIMAIYTFDGEDE